MKSKCRLVLSVVFVNLLLFELLAFIAFHAIGIVKPDRRLDLFLETQLEDIDDAAVRDYLTGTHYDEDLGWDNRPSSDRLATNVAGEEWTATYDDVGSRGSCIESSQTLMATYGDSFTHGDEVNDDQTWQCVLERRFGERVLNFGVGGFGVGQALQKMKRHWKDGVVAPITILAVYDADLGRTLNRYRPFRAENAKRKLAFKPSYQYLDDEVRFFPNPLAQDVETKRQIVELALSVATTDYWESARIRLAPTFPLSLQMLRMGYLAAAGGRWNLGRPAENIWDTTEGREVMSYIIRDFVASARNVGTRPILMLLPNVHEWRNGRADPTYRSFLTEDLLPESLDLTIIDLSERAFDEERFNVRPFSGHPSPYGNTIIGETILDALGHH